MGVRSRKHRGSTTGPAPRSFTPPVPAVQLRVNSHGERNVDCYITHDIVLTSE